MGQDVWPDMVANCLQRLSADNTSHLEHGSKELKPLEEYLPPTTSVQHLLQKVLYHLA